LKVCVFHIGCLLVSSAKVQLYDATYFHERKNPSIF
jgi:hypothetical protein